MDENERLVLARNSASSTNKKLNEVLKHKNKFVFALQAFCQSLDPNAAFEKNNDSVNILEGRDISVCARIRPLLPYETSAGYFETVIANQPKIHTFDPRFDFRKDVRPVTTSHMVDYAFGPEHTNKDIYQAAVTPLVGLALRGGVSTLFAYGQTGSGKTFTVSGILEPLAYDIFKRNQNPEKSMHTNTTVLNSIHLPQNLEQSDVS